jgi:hypothetical protein
MGTESEVVDPVSVDTDLQDWRKMEVLVARRRTCIHVVMLFRQRGARRREEGCVCSARCEIAVCLFVSVWVGDVVGFVGEACEEGVVLVGEICAECGGDGVGKGEWRDVVEQGACVALARTRQRSVGGEVLRDMMDSVGQWV